MNIIDDTLKKLDKETNKRRFSRTSLTMFSAWASTLTMAWVDYIYSGFNALSFLMIAGIAVSSKMGDALAQRLNK